MNLFGFFEQKIDNKGRILFPSALKKQLAASIGEGFILKRSIFETCLELFPMSEWNKEMEKIGKLNRYIKKNEEFIRLFMAGVRMVELDDAGRLLIPKDLVIYGKLDKDVILSCEINKIEIWDKNLYDDFIRRKSEEFSQLAEDVMGNLNT